MLEIPLALADGMNNGDKHSTTFGVSIVTCGNNYYVGDFEKNREVTIEELKELLSKYEQLDSLVEKLTKETHIIY